MERVECPNTAYYRLKDSGFFDMIFEKKEMIHELLLFSDIYGNDPFVSDVGKRTISIIDDARKILNDSSRGDNEKSVLMREILEFEKEYEESLLGYGSVGDKFEKLLFDKPTFISYFLIGDNIFDYKKCGFISRKKLEESVASLILGEKELFQSHSDNRIWRNGEKKNRINLNMHGDLYADQCNISGSEWEEPTLFGEEIHFDTFLSDLNYGAIFAYQDWSQYLLSILRYAQLIGKERIPEITNWREVMDEEGQRGTATAECNFGSDIDFGFRRLYESPLYRRDFNEMKFPLMIHGRQDNIQLPIYDDGKLSFIVSSKVGDIDVTLGRFFEDEKFIKVIEYNGKDIPDVLRANYRYFARDKRLMYKIMERFNRDVNGIEIC